MTQTNTDYLLQVTTAVTDRAYGAAAASNEVVKFNDHLSQAATYSGDDSYNRNGSSQRTETPRLERDDRTWSTSDSKPNNHDNAGPTTPQTSSTDDEQSADVVSGSKPPAEDADSGDHETEESEDTSVAEVAGVGQTATSNSKKTDSESEPNANSDAAATAKSAAVTKKAATQAGDQKAKGNANGQASGALSPDAVAQHVDEAAKLLADAATETAAIEEQAAESQATASEGKRSKAAKSDASTAKPNKHGSASIDGAARGDLPVDGAGTGQVSSDDAQKSDADVETSATAADATKLKIKSDADESSDDDPRTGSQNDSRPGARKDAAVQTNKVDAAQLVGGIPGTTDASANTSPKGKDNERATKPVGAKGEPIASAFARMTRNNVVGSTDSTSGTSDLPQVDPSRFIGRVAKAFQTAQDRGGTLQLRLSPPELGALRIELNVKDGVMSASLQTETANARRLLLDHLPVLRDRLAEQNIRVDRFDVDVRRDGADGQTDARGSQQQQFQHQPDQSAPRRQVQPQSQLREVATPERVATAPSVSDAGLNLIV